MLQSLIDQDHESPVTWLHGCRNKSVHAFKRHLDHITATKSNVKQHTFYNIVTPEDKANGILEGHLNINSIPDLHNDPDTNYFICGPSAFIEKQFQDLQAKGIDKKSIFFEEFGPQLLQMN